MADTGDYDPVNDALSIYTGSRLPQSRGAWPTLPEFRPSAQRVWELPHSRPYDPMNPGMSPEAEDAARVLANPRSTATERTVAMATLAAVLTQGKVRPGAKLKGQTRPNIPAWSFPEGYKPELQGGFGLKSLEAIKQMREGNVRDNPVRVEYVANELRKRGISDAEIAALKLDELLAKGPMIKRSDVEAHIRANRPEIQHAYYQGKEGQGGVQMMQVSDKAGPDYMRDGIRIITYKDPRSGRVYEMHRSGLTNDAGPQDVMKVKDVETGQWLEMPKPNVRGGQDAGQQFEAPASHRFDEPDAFQAMRNDIKQRTSTIPPGAVGGTQYAGGNYVLDATAPHQEHAWGLGPNKEWAEAQAKYKQLYDEKMATEDWNRHGQLGPKIDALEKRLNELDTGRYGAGHITGKPGEPWDYLTHSRVAPVEFQAQGTRLPGTLIEERQSDRYQQLRDRGARASPEAIEKARQAWNDAQVEHQKGYDEARGWVSNVNPDVDWRTYGYRTGRGAGPDETTATQLRESIHDAISYLHNETKPGTRADDGTSIVGEAFTRLNKLKALEEAERARQEEWKAASSGVPGHPLINTAEAFNRFAAKTELLQAAKNAQEQGLPESASYWIAATPGPEQNARYNKSVQARGVRLDTQEYDRQKKLVDDNQKRYEAYLAAGDEGMARVAKSHLDTSQEGLSKIGYKLYTRSHGDETNNWRPWEKQGQTANILPHELPELLGPDLHKRLMASGQDVESRDHTGKVFIAPQFYDKRFRYGLNGLKGEQIGGQAFDRTYGDNAFTPGTVNDTLHAQLRKLDPNTPEWTTANILNYQQTQVRDKLLKEQPEIRQQVPNVDQPHLVPVKRRPYGLDPRQPNPPVEVRAHEMTPEARRKINEQGFSLFQLPVAAGIGASALAGSMLNQYGDPQEDQQ